jgi:predicted nucleic acid-binding protein
VTPRFLDTNVFLRYLTRDDKEKAEKALALLTRMERKEERAVTTPLVIFEVVFTLQRTYGVPRPRIRQLMLPLIALPGLEVQGEELFHRAFDIFVDNNVSFADAYSAAFMERRAIKEIYSWDTDFDRIETVARVEPGENEPSA